jgi:FAD:protein FMN transferase
MRVTTHIHRSRHEPVLGTRLDLSLTVDSRRHRHHAAAAEERVLAEIDRLERIFSVYDDASELRRWWGADATSEVSTDLAHLLGLGLHWQHLTDEVFNPRVSLMTDRWRQAEREDAMPSDAELARLVALVQEPAYQLDGRRATPIFTGACPSFNALAKGLIVDLAVASAGVSADGPMTGVMLNIGGDLLVVGAADVTVAIENPMATYDNAEPLTTITVRNAALATSGSARRGFRIGGRWFSHVIDPRSGRPVESVAQATVLAHDAATADAEASVMSVERPETALAWLDANSASKAALVVGADGTVLRSAHWPG